MVSILLIFIILILFFLYRKYKQTYAYWENRNIASLPVVPILGSYSDVIIQNDHISVFTSNIYNRYRNEKYVGGFKGSNPELMVRDPDVIRSILVKDFNYFINRGFAPEGKDILNQHLFVLSGDKWKTLRQKMSPTFTSSKMKKMFPLIAECGEELDMCIEEKLKNSSVVEIKELMSKYTTDIIGTCAFGLNMNTMKDEESPFREMGRKIFEAPSRKRVVLQFIISLAPALFKLLNIKPRLNQEEIEKFFINLVKQLIAARQSPSPRQDFIDLMLELRTKGFIEVNKNDKIEYYYDSDSAKLDITDELITAQCFVFFAAGFETSSTTMSYALRELALNPDIQTKLQEEVDTVLSNSDGILTYDAVQEMEYLHMVINETLRKYPPVSILNRVCNTTYKLPGTNIFIDKGVKIMIPVYALQHDATYFPDPEEFRPERFYKITGNTHNPFTYMPFGDGPRNCIGARFAILQSTIGLVSILKKYSVEPCSKTPLKIDLSERAFVLQSKGGIYLKMVPRISTN